MVSMIGLSKEACRCLHGLTCISACHDEDAPSLRWQVLLGERRRGNEEALPEGIEVDRHFRCFYDA